MDTDALVRHRVVSKFFCLSVISSEDEPVKVGKRVNFGRYEFEVKLRFGERLSGRTKAFSDTSWQLV